MQVTTVDGRVMSGTFVCLDHLGNLLLFDTYCQYCIAAETLERALNQVIIPQAHLKSAQVLVRCPQPWSPSRGLACAHLFSVIICSSFVLLLRDIDKEKGSPPERYREGGGFSP